jgi:hypothetical protein
VPQELARGNVLCYAQHAPNQAKIFPKIGRTCRRTGGEHFQITRRVIDDLTLSRFLYALFLAMDANFRLKRKDVSSEEANPGLSTGWAFFCEVSAFMAHLAENWDQPQEVRRFIMRNA